MSERSRVICAALTKAQWEPTSTRWESLYPVLPDFIYEPSPEDSFAAIALATDTPVLEVVYDHMAQRGGAGVVWEGLPNVRTQFKLTGACACD